MGLLVPRDQFFSDQMFKNFIVHTNATFDTLDVDMNSGSGVPVARTETTFGGTHSYTQDASGLKLQQYKGWTDTLSINDADTEDDTTTYDDTQDASVLFGALWGTSATDVYYEGDGVYLSASYPLLKVGRINTDLIDYTASTPAGTTMVVEIALSRDNGFSWGAWTAVADNAASGVFIPGEDTSLYRVKYRVTMSTTNSANTAALTSYVHRLHSRTLWRMASNGVMGTYNGSTNAMTEIAI